MTKTAESPVVMEYSDRRPSLDELVARARQLAEVFGRNAARAEEERRMPDDLADALRNSGLLRILQPVRFSGYEHHPAVAMKAIYEIAAATGSGGWFYALTMLHNWVAGLFEQESQEEIFADSLDPILSVVFAPTGTAIRDANGYRLSGQWKYATASPNADWIVVNGRVVDDGKTVIRSFLVPRGDFVVLDTWHVTGLRGTGSNDVKIENVFVPERRTLLFEDVHAGTTPGAVASTCAYYAIPSTPLLSHTAAAVAIGILIGATREYEARARTRTFTFDHKQQSKQVGTQMRLARALAVIRSCTALQESVLGDLAESTSHDGGRSPEVRAEVRMYAAYIVDVCQKALAELYLSAGSNAIFESSPMQRAFRDIHALSTHVAVAYDEAAEAFGQTRLGMHSTSGML